MSNGSDDSDKTLFTPASYKGGETYVHKIAPSVLNTPKSTGAEWAIKPSPTQRPEGMYQEANRFQEKPTNGMARGLGYNSINYPPPFGYRWCRGVGPPRFVTQCPYCKHQILFYCNGHSHPLI